MSTSFEPENLITDDMPTTQPDDSHQPAEPVKTQRAWLGGMFAPLRIGNFRLLFGGQTISTFGDTLYAVALPWLILNNGGNAQELGFVLTAYGIPRVGSILLGGWLSDRLHPRRIMLIADVVRTILMALLATLALRGQPPLWQLCAIAIPLGAFGGAFLPASSAILPDLLSDDDLPAGNALSYSSNQGATLIGSALAGIIVATLMAGPALAIDALTFVVSAVSLFLMRAGSTSMNTIVKAVVSPENPQTGEQVDQLEVPITFGRFVSTSRLIQVTLLVVIIANFCLGGLLEVTLPTLVHGPMNGGASGYGLILAGFGAGALLGSLAVGIFSKVRRKGLIALLIGLGMGLALAFLPYGGIIGAIALMATVGVCSSITNVLLITLIQLTLPRHLLGRVMALIMFGSLGSYPISVALAGVLTSSLGPTILFPFSGAALILALLFGLTQKELRDL
jgi:predicted MFS family arabinose efflux permease